MRPLKGKNGSPNKPQQSKRASENSTKLIQSLQKYQEELQAANEKLATSEEELRAQNEELMASREELERERKRYRDLFETAPDGYVVTDSQGLIQQCNQAAAWMLGIAENDLIQRKISFFLFADEVEEYVKHRSNLTAYGTCLPRWEAKIQPVGKSPFWADITASVSQNEYGKTIGIRWLIRDITERKQAEEALHTSETFLRAITNSSPETTFVKDVNGRMLLANLATLAAIGKPQEAVLGKTDEEFLNDPAIGRAIMANDRRVMESCHTEVIEELVPGSDGLRTFLSTKTPYRNTEGKVIGVIGNARDITDRKRAEAALRESETRLCGILDNLQDAYFQADLSGHFMSVSPSAVQMFGYDSVEEMIGLPAETLYAKAQDRASLLDEMQRSNHVNDYVRQGRRKDGTTFWTSLTAQVCRDSTGAIVGTEGVVRDITERKRAEEALQKSEERFRLILRNAPVSVAAQNRELRYIWACNHRTAQPGEIIGKLDSDIFTPEEAAPGSILIRAVDFFSAKSWCESLELRSACEPSGSRSSN